MIIYLVLKIQRMKNIANHKKNVRMSECQENCQNVGKTIRMSGKLSEYLKHIIIIIKYI